MIPWNFSERLDDAGRTSVQALVDGTDDNSAQLAEGYAQAVVETYATNVQLEWFARYGLAQQGNLPLAVDYRTWFNEDLESRNFIVPGVVALVMAVMGTLLSSLTIAREWERGTMEQLISTPVTADRGYGRQAGSLLRNRNGRRGALRGDLGRVVRVPFRGERDGCCFSPRRCF